MKARIESGYAPRIIKVSAKRAKEMIAEGQRRTAKRDARKAAG